MNRWIWIAIFFMGLSWAPLLTLHAEVDARTQKKWKRQARKILAKQERQKLLRFYHHQNFGDSYFQCWLDRKTGLPYFPANKRWKNPDPQFLKVYNACLRDQLEEKGLPDYHRKGFRTLIEKPSEYYRTRKAEVFFPEQKTKHPALQHCSVVYKKKSGILQFKYGKKKRGELDLNRTKFLGMGAEILWGPENSELCFIRFYASHPDQLSQILVWDLRYGVVLNHEYVTPELGIREMLVEKSRQEVGEEKNKKSQRIAETL